MEVDREKLNEMGAFNLYEYEDNLGNKYIRPNTKHGYPDFELMLDYIGLTIGAIYEHRSERLGDTRGIVKERTDKTITHIDEYTVERGGIRTTEIHARNGDIMWDKMREHVINPDMNDQGATPLKWWQAYCQGRLEVIGHISEIGDGWPVRE